MNIHYSLCTHLIKPQCGETIAVMLSLGKVDVHKQNLFKFFAIMELHQVTINSTNYLKCWRQKRENINININYY